MADSSFSVDPGTTTAFDTRTEATNGNARAVVVIGDPSVNAGVAPVDGIKGLAVDLTASGTNTNPIYQGIQARKTLPTPAANGTITGMVGDQYGRLEAIKPNVSNISSAGTPITTNTNTSIITAPGASTHLKIYRLFAQNSSATGTWCYWGNGSGVKTRPFYLAQNQAYATNLEGCWELSSNTALFMNTATTGANIEWCIDYETVSD